MDFPIPTLDEVVQRSIDDVETSVEQTTPLLPQSLLRIIAAANGGGHHEQYQYIQWIARQAFPDTAVDENLQRWAAIWDVIPKERTFSRGFAVATGADGAAILTGTLLLGRNKVEYEVQQSATIAGGVATIEVIARTAGAVGDLATGEVLTFVSSIPTVDQSAAISEPGINGGFDDESSAELLTRLLQRIQSPPQGGSVADYQIWTTEVPGVTRVWVLPGHMGPGSVGITFVTDNAADLIPTAAKVAEVQAHLEEPERKPVTSRPVVFAPQRRPLDLTLRITPDTPELRAAVETELTAFLPQYGVPDSTVALSEIQAMISSLPGEQSHEIISPTAGFKVAPTEIVTAGAITWL